MAKSQRNCSLDVAEECRERIRFVLGQIDLSEEIERRWLDIPKLSDKERARLEAVQVAEPCERLQALQEAFDAGHFDFVTKLLACSYSRCGRRAHHPLLLWRIWMAMLAVESGKPGTFLESVDDLLQLRLFLEVMSHEQLPSERRIKGFASERMTPVIEYLVLWHQFMVLADDRIEITAEFGTDSADMHGQARMKSDASAMFITPLLGWLIDECRRFCEHTGRSGLSQADQKVLIEAFEQLDWKPLGSFGRQRHLLLAAIRDTLKGQLVTPHPYRVRLDSSPRDGPIPEDMATFAKELAGEFLERMKADPERTRDLMGRHRAMSEGIVNNLMNHQGVRHAKWKGLALTRVQVGLAVVMINTLKWHKVLHGRLEPMTLKPAA